MRKQREEAGEGEGQKQLLEFRLVTSASAKDAVNRRQVRYKKDTVAGAVTTAGARLGVKLVDLGFVTKPQPQKRKRKSSSCEYQPKTAQPDPAVG